MELKPDTITQQTQLQKTEAKTPSDNTIYVETMVASRTLAPAVVLRWNDADCQMTPDEARQHGLKILAAADAAESDAFLVQYFATFAVGDDLAQILKEFRAFREKQRQP